MTAISGELYVGMRGPGAALTFTITKPSAFSGSFSAATRTLTVEITQDDGTVATFSSFSWGSLTTTGGVATAIPDGTEITARGPATIAASIVLNGTTYDFRPQRTTIKQLDLVD